jgi:chromosome segregation ATPase
MKKIIFIGLFVFLTANVFCQAPDKAQQKKVNDIHKSISKEHGDILKNQVLTVDEKKSRVDDTKSARDAQLADVLTSEQIDALKAKDPISWNKVYLQIEKQEKSRLKSEMDQRLKEVDKDVKDLKGQQDDIKKQMSDLKKKEKDLSEQQKALNAKKKAIRAEYK